MASGFFGLFVLSASIHGQELPPKKISTFELPAVGGGTVSLPSDAKATVICFLGTECPLARTYAPKLQKLADAMESHGVFVLGIVSNLQDSIDEVEQFRKNNGLRFPIGMDYDQKIADLLGATRTPEAFILDQHRFVRYQGRIDDQFLPGVSKSKPIAAELNDGLDDVLSGKPVRVSHTQPVGCLIGKVRPEANGSEVTYTGQIASIFSKHCVECHRSGEIGPFAMTKFDELRGWGDMIVEVIDQSRMPPWHAAPGHAAIRNARVMPEDEKKLVRQWVSSGMPYGQVRELPPVPEVKSQWQLPRAPDVEISMRSRPFHVPADGSIDYQYFVVDPGFQEDRWVTAAQVIPGQAAVVHHAIVFVRPPDGADFRGINWLTAYVPGQRPGPLPPATARRIPAGSKLVFQMHYTPNGQAADDITKVGMLLADPTTIENEAITLVAINQEFEIPPRVANYEVAARIDELPKGGKLLAASPHMHVRGKSFQLFTRNHNGQQETLLEVPKYDFNWQHTYELSQPLELDTIEELSFVARFDNSTSNPVNPNPNTAVSWGDQTWEEMAIAFFEVSQPLKQPSDPTPDHISKARTKDIRPSDRSHAAEKFATDFLSALDRDRDGIVTFEEAPLSIQRFSFWRFDTNNDYKIDRAELLKLER